MSEGVEAGAQTSLRGLEILEVLAGLEQPATLARIAARAKLDESAAYRTLRRLTAAGYVDHLARRGYRLGSRSVALAVLVGPEPQLLRAAHRQLARLALTTGFSTALHLRSGSHRVLIAGFNSTEHPMQDEVAMGERAPLTSGGAGLAILAHLPEEEVRAIIARQSPAEAQRTLDQLARVRTAGYRIGGRQHHASVRGVSAPLLHPETGTPLGSLTIAGLAEHTTDSALRAHAPALIRTCEQLAPEFAALLGPAASRMRRGLDLAAFWQDLD